MITRYWLPAFLLAASAAAHCETMQLTTDVPECRMPSGRVLPGKYYKVAAIHKEFRWVLKVPPDARLVGEAGWERIDGSSMFDWFTFYRVDLNNDGYCDWYVNISSPVSTGGDRDSINTIYLGGSKRWSRIGATLPDDKPDGLGRGQSNDEQEDYLYGEDIAVVHDAASKMNYFITAFYDRHVQRDRMPGYRLFDWDSGKQTLRLLDKWQPGSKAAEVYAFFKAHGAREPGDKPATVSDAIQKFDPGIEARELEVLCDPNSSQRSSPDLYPPVSPHLLAHCKR